jgi:asparagine synthase (glutamine-hydrolysing)
MCGISGIVNFNATEPVDRLVLERMTLAQSHRGPDDCGYFVDGNVGLGHRRLSVIDRSGGSQPIFNEDGSVAIVFNGEVYNYRELTKQLSAQGHQFKTHCDTEAIVHAYEQDGDDCVRGLRGMFAFAIWDRRQRRLLLVRDRMGIKPLYYYFGDGVFVFASEIKALLEHPGVPRELDVHALDLFLALRYVPGPATIFKRIFKLQPAHYLTIDNAGIHIRRYWDIEYSEPAQFSESACLEQFDSLFEESVRLRLIAEVPLGVFLSGGLDSSATLASMSRIMGQQKIKTFSVGYDLSGASHQEAADADELKFARVAADHFGAEHHEFKLSATQLSNALPLMVEHLDEPLGDPTCIPLYFISRMARDYITVVLSGEGADETLGGYALYQRILSLEKVRQRLGPLRTMVTLGSCLPWSERLAGYIRRLESPLESHYRGVVKGIGPQTRASLTGAQRFQQAEARLCEVFAPHFRHTQYTTKLNQMLYADSKVWLPENLLLKADKMTMAASIELRVPFLDHKLVEFTATLPDALKIREGKGKWILRQIMGKRLPPVIIKRPKKGFSIPIASWMRLELKDFIHDTLLSNDSACSTYFDKQAIAAVVRCHDEGRFSGFQEVWSLLVFEEWHRRFMSAPRSKVAFQLLAS